MRDKDNNGEFIHNDECTFSDEQFFHADEFNTQAHTALHRKDSFRQPLFRMWQSTCGTENIYTARRIMQREIKISFEKANLSVPCQS